MVVTLLIYTPFKEIKMPINTRTEYAVRALLEIIDNNNEPISVRQISETQRLPRKYVEHLLANLKSAGLIESTTGSKGGYVLKKDPLLIKLYDVVKAVEDITWDVRCGNRNHDYCMGNACHLTGFWNEFGDKLDALLKDFSLNDIHRLVLAKGVSGA